MAGFTRRRRMEPDQRKVCQVVIEFNLIFPAGHLVTSSTVRAERGPVDIVHLMAGNTSRLKRHIGLAGCMAVLALQVRMGALEIKIGVGRVIKARILPLLGIVAFGAIAAVGALMHVVKRVAGFAFRAQRLKYPAPLMTTGASDIRMSA